MKEVQETQVRSLGREVLLEEEMANHSSILASRILWAEEPGGLQFIGSTKSQAQHTHKNVGIGLGHMNWK